MVKLRHLVSRNFKHLDVEIDFPDGILAVSGPNESGKSSILEAVLFAFFGRTHKAPRGEKNRLINYDADSLFVQLVFDIGEKKYRITRRLYKKRSSEASLDELGPGDQSTKIATTVKAVGEAINELLGGISLSDMLASNVVLQKDLDHLVKLQKMERRQVINAMMGRECFTRAVEKLTLELRLTRREFEPAKGELEQLKNRRDLYQKNTKEFKLRQKESTELDKKLKEISQTYAKTEKNYNAVKAYKEAKDEQDRIQRELEFKTKLRQQREEELARLGKLESRRNKLQSQQKRFKNLENDITAFERVQETASDLNEKISEKRAADESIQRLQSRIKELEPLRDAATEYERIQSLRLKAETSQSRIMSPLLYIPSIGLLAAGLGIVIFNVLVGIIFLFCSLPFLVYLGKVIFAYQRVKPHLESLRAKEKELSEQASRYRDTDVLTSQLVEIEQHNEQMEIKLHQLIDAILHQLTALSSDIIDSSSLPDEAEASALLAAVESAEQKLNKLRAKRDTISEDLSSVEDQLADITQLEEELKQISLNLVDLERQLTSLKLPKLPSEISTYSEKLYIQLDQQYRELGEEKAGHQAELKQVKQRIEELTTLLKEEEGVLEEFEKKDKEVAQLKDKLDTNKLTIELLREVAEHGREQVRPGVVGIMERLLSSITDGKYRFPKLSEDYSLKVYSSTAGEYIQADLFSGGTEDQFLLALRLGFAITLLPHGRGTAPQFLLLDEPFAGSDIQRRDNIIRLLQDELSKTFMQIIVVSHQRVVLDASEHKIRMINGRIIHTD
jgi:exonuclease SbcC